MCTNAWLRQCLLKGADYEQWGPPAVEQALGICSEATLNSVLQRPAVVPEADHRSTDLQAVLYNLHHSENSALC